jgi:hypothetical protein
MASQDDPLAVKVAEGMRSTSVRGRRSFGYFSFAVERKVTRQQGETKRSTEYHCTNLLIAGELAAQPIPNPPVPDSTGWDHSDSARAGGAGV